MDISNLNKTELGLLATKTDDKDVLRDIATKLEITFSGNTGPQKLKEKIMEACMEVDEPEDEPEMEEAPMDPVSQALAAHIESKDKDDDVHVKAVEQKYSVAEMMEMDAAQVKDDKLRRNVIRTQALRQIRVRITNLDPDDAAVPGSMVTCYSKYTGKVSKYIPFGEENEHGYHIPKIIFDDLKARKFAVRKEVKKRGSSFGVKEYKTVWTNKFSIEELPPLTKAQLAGLAAKQAASGSIDRK